ncbi:aldose 1-epimerase family protein [Planosporangium thailandense]|uniref:Aldose 1-epimerase family protein n=1 Tax=Planosporangium thailandense TaxID=765197 RepID=A0ABX0Y6D3_9ACTN|nr:aldose 1-epimerase family protein [Planosporangium thailandense]NJC72859.1 aldose 1-epimerase family protein [Planosporangium thailandense]
MDTLTQLPSGTQWTIEADGHRATVVEVGGGLREYRAGGVDVLFGYAADEICPASAGKVLAPWPNRIRDGRYSFGGDVHQLTLTEPARHNAIHGLVNWARWRRVEATGSSVTVEYEVVPQPGYPWPLVLRTTWSVGTDGLVAEHTATNAGAGPCPFGLATHPYVQVPGVRVDDLLLRVPGRSRLLVDGRMLPIGAAKVAGSEYDFTQPKPIGELALDTAFGDVDRDADGRSAVTLTTADGRGAEVWADGAFGWWQVFTSDSLAPDRHRRSVAIEPMTCPPDAFRSGRDVVVIQPGETWRGRWGIRPLPGVSA